MTAYVIFLREKTTNEDELKIYSQLAPPTLAGHPATPLAFYGTLQVLEGPAFEGSVVIAFPSVQEAQAWYHSPAYQAAALHRKAGADYRCLSSKGCRPLEPLARRTLER